MTSTNPPPNDDRRNELLEIQNRLTDNLNRSLKNLQLKFENFTNPVTRLTDSISRLDKTNISALKIGVTNAKLTESVNKNSNILTKSITSNQQLQSAIIDGFGQGVRFQTKALSELTTEMVATNQNTQALNKLNSDLVLFTGNNIDVVDNLAKVNKEVSDKYGVSNDKLIGTLNALRESLQTASFFGDTAVNSLGEISKQLVGRAGGTDITGALGALNRLLVGGFETERAAALLGATGVRQRIAEGGRVSLQDIIPILDQLEARRESIGGGRFGLDILSQTLGFSKSQTAELLNLAEIARRDFRLNEDIKKTTNETYASIENINKAALNFYDNTATQMLAVLGTVSIESVLATTKLTSIASMMAASLGMTAMRGPTATPGGRYQGTNAGYGLGGGGGGGRGRFGFGAAKDVFKRGLGGVGAGMTATALIGAGSQMAGAGAALSNTANFTGLGVSLGGFFGPAGMLIGGGLGAIAGGITDLISYSERTAKATEEELKIKKDEEKKRRAEEAAMEIKRVSVLAGYIRSRLSLDYGEEGVRQMININRTLQDSLKAQTRGGVSVTPDRNSNGGR